MGQTYKVRLSPLVIEVLTGCGDHLIYREELDDAAASAEWRSFIADEFPDLASVFEQIIRKADRTPEKPVTVDADEAALRHLAVHGSWMWSTADSGQPSWGRAGHALCKQLTKLAADNESLSEFREFLKKQLM